MPGLSQLQRQLYQALLAARSDSHDARRHEFILNVLLCGVIIACLTAAASALINHPNAGFEQGDSFRNIGLLSVSMALLWRLSRLGHYLIAAYLFLGCISLAVLNLLLTWSFELPTVVLGAAIVIIIAGVILGTKAALRVAIVTSASYLLLAELQIYGIGHPNSIWLRQSLTAASAVDHTLMLAVIGLVSWLANHEIDRSLQHTRLSRQALAKERDQLETKVKRRTKQLEQAQLVRLLELQRFAEFGRLSAQLLHEVATPLTVASLYLGQLDHQPLPALRQARRSLRQLERYVGAARKQLQHQSQPVSFSVQRELRQLLTVLSPLAQTAGLGIYLEPSVPVRLIGDPVKFNQIVSNLVANAIDAYADMPLDGPPQRVDITIRQSARNLHLSVRDHGKGITAQQLPQLFEPFYSTKLATNRGLGIGLAIVKQAVENDFGGSITVSSSPTGGTVFNIRLPLRRSPVLQSSHTVNRL